MSEYQIGSEAHERLMIEIEKGHKEVRDLGTIREVEAKIKSLEISISSQTANIERMKQDILERRERLTSDEYVGLMTAVDSEIVVLNSYYDRMEIAENRLIELGGKIVLPEQVFTYNYPSKYGTFKLDYTIINGIHSPSAFEAENLFNAWLKQKEAETPEPAPPEPELEIKDTWWVIRPSGLIEQVTVTQKFVDTMTAQGWIFSKDKPTIEEPQNQNISIVFYIGKGGDLKTHFGINSIIITPDEAEQLAGWLFQNYNTKILFVMNRLTDDIRTHTQQQLKDLIIQKLKDDQPISDDITEEDIKKPSPKNGHFSGASAIGLVAALVLVGAAVTVFKKEGN